jgi:hypothetical protein
MKANQLVFALIIALFTVNTFAAPNPKPPPEPQDVNVVNTPNVTVTNPQTSVTVDNVAGNPVPVTVQNQSSGCPETQFVGFTTDTFNGGQGVVTYANACRQDYPGSWMCTSEEFLNTRVYPSASGSGWIRPTPVPMAAAAGSGIAVGKEFVGVQDASGVIAHRGFGFAGISCRGWSDGTANNEFKGLNVNAQGKYDASNCDSVRAVACCAPTP